MPIDSWDVFANGLRVYYTFSYAGASGITYSYQEANPGPDSFREKHETPTRHYSAYNDYTQPFSGVPKELRHLIGSNGYASFSDWPHIFMCMFLIFGRSSWAINGPKTTGGQAMINMNPHLPYVGFFRWYEAHFVVASEDLDLYGTGFIGLPNLQIGFNDYVGWTHTVNVIQPYSVYKLRLADENTYYYDDEILELGVEEAPFLVQLEDGCVRVE